MDKTLIAIIGAFLSGGLGVTIFNRFGMSKKESGDALLMLVKQLQENVNANNQEIKELKAEVHQWRDKYYAELEEKNKLSIEMRQLKLQLQKINANTVQ